MYLVLLYGKRSEQKGGKKQKNIQMRINMYGYTKTNIFSIYLACLETQHTVILNSISRVVCEETNSHPVMWQVLDQNRVITVLQPTKKPNP